MENDIIKNEELINILLNFTYDNDKIDKETLKIILDQYIVLTFNWENVKLILKGDNKKNEDTSSKL